LETYQVGNFMDQMFQVEHDSILYYFNVLKSSKCLVLQLRG